MDDRRHGVPRLTDFAADLHLHSTASDGALPPAEVVRRAARVGLATIALTDHDTVAGYESAAREGEAVGIRVIPAAELSVAVPWGEMHLLAYGFDPTYEPILAFMARATSLRRDRGQAITEALRRLNVPVTFADVELEATGAPIGRPHVARALVARRVVRTLDEAFDRFLARGRPAYVPKVLPPLEQATALVREAGGVASAAHLKDRGVRPVLETLKARGVEAIEVRHPSHSPSARALLESVVRELALLPTGGSDWHGEAAVGPSHGSIGGERIPADWVAGLDRVTQDRKAARNA